MSVVRELWGREVDGRQCRPWTCPTCSAGVLYLDQDTFRHFPTAATRQLEEKDPEMEEARFTAFLVCGAFGCQERVVAHGRVVWRQGYDPMLRGEAWSETLLFEGVHPAPLIIPVPDGCPASVRAAVVASCEMFWSDPESCTNKIRIAIENALDARKVKRFVVNTKGKKDEIKLHNRIDHHFRPKHPDLADLLLAAKWLGNSGAHGHALTWDDCLDGFDLLGAVFAELYEKKSKKLAALAQQINKRKGPRRRRGRSSDRS